MFQFFVILFCSKRNEEVTLRYGRVIGYILYTHRVIEMNYILTWVLFNVSVGSGHNVIRCFFALLFYP